MSKNKEKLRATAIGLHTHAQRCKRCAKNQQPCTIARVELARLQIHASAVLQDCVTHSYLAGPEKVRGLTRRIRQFAETITKPKF